MSKAVLVIDMPESCWECDINQCDTDSRWCGKEFKDIKENFENKTKPDWCPLKALPDKESGADIYDESDWGFQLGWNYFRSMISCYNCEWYKDDVMDCILSECDKRE